LEDNIKMNRREIDLGVLIRFIWLGIGMMAGSFEHDNEPSGSIKDGEFIDLLSVLSASQEGLCSAELLK
jgi:hypothetical protein